MVRLCTWPPLSWRAFGLCFTLPGGSFHTLGPGGGIGPRTRIASDRASITLDSASVVPLLTPICCVSACTRIRVESKLPAKPCVAGHRCGAIAVPDSKVVYPSTGCCAEGC